MKRRTVHFIFGALTLGCGLTAVIETWRIKNISSDNQILARLNSSQATDELPAPAQDSTRLQLAYANALSRRGEVDAAARAYTNLSQQKPDSPAARSALFNLGNLRLRQGIQARQAGKSDFLPDIELAKQTYRDLLRIDTRNWDARYNLEYALLLAPEQDSALGSGEKDIKERRRIKLRGMSSVQLP